MRIITILFMVSLMTLVGCDWKPRAGAPWKQELLLEGPDGPPLFKQGWRHGCESGISGTSNHLHKFFYKFKQDYRLAGNKEYYTGWRVAFLFCHRYIFQYTAREYF